MRFFSCVNRVIVVFHDDCPGVYRPACFRGLPAAPLDNKPFPQPAPSTQLRVVPR